ncbi:stAR-related lipid transfer protein 7, mitochondrial-like isoform X3 [Stegodyphus dumicola]|uniref:stAR-related lipid transfer protein 7, mitochondrial-like isoform X3 n=1 Tax=Stegodyphus dumicola TaxID=202533 RepID=UPI0015AD39C2|nr:stAR-related lipid transfer protein 7, mitochondrial-like isoform X3 [Stegodyphus dumicola]
MNGCYVYNKIARNFRSYYRGYGESELSIELRRSFALSSRFDTNNKKVYTFKSIFHFDDRKKLFEYFKTEVNEKLAVLGEILTRQCNFIVSQRVRRTSQVWNLYARLYTENTIKQIISQFAKNFRLKKRPFAVLFGAALFNWDKEKITDDEIQNCIYELDRYRSSDDHPTKPITGQRLVTKLIEDGWEAVIQKECVQVWRKAFPNSYLYEYKIMGTFYDVPARTFFAVQTDIEYRKKWDKLVIKLDIIDKEATEGGCEVMHWVMHYPYPMYSREYVYIRRAVVSKLDYMKTNAI